jgi:hypothetical protein
MSLAKNSIISILCLTVWVNDAKSDNIPSSMLTCNKKLNDAERLRCYDELSQISKTQTIEKPIVNVTSEESLQSSPIKILSKIESFGLSEKQKAKGEVETIVALVTKIEHDLRKNLIVTLDIEQIWLQTDGTRMLLREGDSVSLDRGALGSFFLGVEGKNRRMRVKRIK